jgi:hypothetical protein
VTQDESKKTLVVYKLAIIGGELSEDESAAFGQVEKIKRVLRNERGAAIGSWEYQFETFEAAHDFAPKLRHMGIAFDEVRIQAINERTGGELVS